MLRRGERLIRVKGVVGVIHRTIQRWVRWYEAGGIEEVTRHRQSNWKTHRQAWTAQQEARLRQAVEGGRFRTAGEVVRWYAEVPGIEAPDWLRRWRYRKRVPRPLAERADVQAREAFGGPSAAGSEAGDEMRAGPHGQSRSTFLKSRSWGIVGLSPM